MKNRSVQTMTDARLVGIIRMDDPARVEPVCEALVRGGVRVLEITGTIPGAVSVLRKVQARFEGQALVGAGSVLNAAMAEAMVDAGARFLVSPVVDAEIVEAGHGAGCPVMLGGYSPTELQRAHEAGADLVKIFPADQLGPGYVRAVRAPLPHLRLVPTGGVDLGNLRAFLEAGSAAVGVGSALTRPELLRSEDWTGLQERASTFVEACREPRQEA